jgi:hypothetical protein
MQRGYPISPGCSRLVRAHFELTNSYCARNHASDLTQVSLSLEHLKGITNNTIGIIELAEDLDIEKVTDIFVCVNSAGVALSQADFAMSKIQQTRPTEATYSAKP